MHPSPCRAAGASRGYPAMRKTRTLLSEWECSSSTSTLGQWPRSAPSLIASARERASPVPRHAAPPHTPPLSPPRHPSALIEKARESLEAAKTKKHIVDYYVGRCGDDIDLIITHRHGVDSEAIHRLAWDTFMACTTAAKRLHLYGAGQDLLAAAFAGNVKGMGPGVGEMEFVERPSEPIVVFL